MQIGSNRRRAVAWAIAAAAAFAMPTAALAQDPVDAQYDTEVEVTQESVEPGPATVPGDPGGPGDSGDSGDGGGVLPFTGADMLVLVAVAISLASFGVLLHRLSSGRRSDLHLDSRG